MMKKKLSLINITLLALIFPFNFLKADNVLPYYNYSQKECHLIYSNAQNIYKVYEQQYYKWVNLGLIEGRDAYKEMGQ